MIATTFNGNSVWLWPYLPDAYAIDAELSVSTDLQQGLTMRESRQRRTIYRNRKISFKCYLNPSCAADFRSAMAVWQNKQILVPFFPSQRFQTQPEKGSHLGRIRIWWNAFTTGNFEIQTNSDPTTLTAPSTLSVSSLTQTAPLMLAKFDEMPKISTPYYDGGVMVSVSFVEVASNSQALSAVSVALTNGPSINGTTPPLFNLPIDWQKRSIETVTKIQREQIGLGKDPADTYYTHQPRMQHKFTMNLVGSQISYFLTLFNTTVGSVSPFWIQSDADPSANIYGRFLNDVIQIKWIHPSFSTDEIVEVSFDFQDLPSELVIPSGETFGTTIGPIAASTAPFFGYQISNSGSTWLYTPNVLDTGQTTQPGPGGNYISQKIEHGAITNEINLQISDTTLTVFDFQGNPFMSMITAPQSEPLFVTIYEGVLSSPTAAQPIFIGRAVAAKTTGPKMEITLRSFTSFMDIEGPRRTLINTCKATCFDAKCGLNITSWTTSVTLGTGSGAAWVFSGASYPDHVLAGSWAERTMPDGSTQRYMIVDNVSSGSLTVTFTGSITPAPTGSESGWKIIRACDNTWGTCNAVYSNTANFRGFPRIPPTNPALIPAPNSNGGKK
jgi:hypothetical protein